MPSPASAKGRPAARKGRRRVLIMQSWWQDRILRGVAEYAAAHDWELQCRMRWTHLPPALENWSGDGIIAYSPVSPSMRKASSGMMSFISSAQVPVVEMQVFADYPGVAKIICPNEDIGRLAAEHLLSLQFRELAYVTFEENALEQQRRLGFQAAVEAAGARFHRLSLRNLLQDLATLPKPLALFAVNDLNASELLLRCRDAGLRVPEEIAVVGVDDTEILCDFAAIPLTSINCNFERQGYEAAALLDSLMDGAPVPQTPRLVPPRGVTVRRSTDLVAIPDLDTARVLRALRDRFREGVNVKQIVAELDLPLRQVGALFRKHVGLTPHQELTRLRISHAKQLLRDPKTKVETLAHESGFSSRFHLVQAFRRHEGLTPKQYRQNLPG